MKAFAIAGIVVTVACASAGTNGVGSVGGGDQQANVKRVSIGDVTLQANGDAGAPSTWHAINAPVADVWRQLPVAYGNLGLSVTRYDSTQHVIEGERLRSHAAFGGKELTALMDCGNVAGMPNASRFVINISTRTMLRGNGSGISVSTSVIASAKPDGVAGIFSPCVVNPAAAERIDAVIAAAAAHTGLSSGGPGFGANDMHAAR